MRMPRSLREWIDPAYMPDWLWWLWFVIIVALVNVAIVFAFRLGFLT